MLQPGLGFGKILQEYNGLSKEPEPKQQNRRIFLISFSKSNPLLLLGRGKCVFQQALGTHDLIQLGQGNFKNGDRSK